MAFRVEDITITGCTAAGLGFDLVLDAGKTRLIGLTEVQCHEIAPGVERFTLPIDLVLNWRGKDGLVRWMSENCPDALDCLEAYLERIVQVLPGHITGEDPPPPRIPALKDVRLNPDVDCSCGEELCYWDAQLGMVICVE